MVFDGDNSQSPRRDIKHQWHDGDLVERKDHRSRREQDMGLLNKLIGVCCGGIFVMLVDLVMIHGCSLGISMFILSLMIKEE